MSEDIDSAEAEERLSLCSPFSVRLPDPYPFLTDRRSVSRSTEQPAEVAAEEVKQVQEEGSEIVPEAPAQVSPLVPVPTRLTACP